VHFSEPSMLPLADSISLLSCSDFTRALGKRLGADPELAAQLTVGANKPTEKGDAGIGQSMDISAGAFSRVMPTLRIDGPFGGESGHVMRCETDLRSG
jgi:NADPH oxidase